MKMIFLLVNIKSKYTAMPLHGCKSNVSTFRAREEFMCHMKLNITEQSIQEDRAWILVDSDGEEVLD